MAVKVPDDAVSPESELPVEEMSWAGVVAPAADERPRAGSPKATSSPLANKMNRRLPFRKFRTVDELDRMITAPLCACPARCPP